MENLVGDAFEVSLLKRLPPTTDLGSGVTAGQRLADLRTKKDQKNKGLAQFRGGNGGFV